MRIYANLAALVVGIFVGTAGAIAVAQTPSPSPTPPPSDIYVVDVKTKHDAKTKQDELKFGEPKKLTDYVGYNNQQFFSPDCRTILYTSIRYGQPNIHQYVLT